MRFADIAAAVLAGAYSLEHSVVEPVPLVSCYGPEWGQDGWLGVQEGPLRWVIAAAYVAVTAAVGEAPLNIVALDSHRPNWGRGDVEGQQQQHDTGCV